MALQITLCVKQKNHLMENLQFGLFFLKPTSAAVLSGPKQMEQMEQQQSIKEKQEEGQSPGGKKEMLMTIFGLGLFIIR